MTPRENLGQTVKLLEWRIAKLEAERAGCVIRLADVNAELVSLRKRLGAAREEVRRRGGSA